MTSKYRSLCIGIWALFYCAPSAVAQSDLPAEVVAYADHVFYNGKVLTADDAFTIAEAVAVRDGRILAVGENARIRRLAGPRTRMVDLQGKTVTPGFMDTHFHLHNYAFTSEAGGIELWPAIRIEDLGADKSPANYVRVLRAKAKDFPRREGWVVITEPRGELHSILEREIIPFVTREELDSIFPDEPAVISPSQNNNNSYCLLNSIALKRLLDKVPLNTEGIVLDPKTGKPTGQLVGRAAELFATGIVPWPDLNNIVVPALKKAIPRYSAQGLTMIQTKTPGFVMSALRELWKRDELAIRWRASIDVGPDVELGFRYLGNLTDIGDSYLRIVSGPGEVPSAYWDATYNKPKPLPGEVISRRTDRTPEARAAAAAAEGPSPAYLAAKYGWSTSNVHNNGDLSTDMYLQELEKGLKDRVIEAAGQRFVTDHSTMLTPQTPAGNQFEKMKKLGIIPSLNANYLLEGPREAKGFAYAHMSQIEQHAAKWGKDRAAGFLPAKSLIRAGFKPTSESDRWEYERSNPLYILERLITRTEEGKDVVWGPNERVTRQEALWMKTNWAAGYTGEQKDLGTLEPGKLADLVILDGDYMTVPAADISKIKVLLTMLGGRIVYRDGSISIPVSASPGEAGVSRAR